MRKFWQEFGLSARIKYSVASLFSTRVLNGQVSYLVQIIPVRSNNLFAINVDERIRYVDSFLLFLLQISDDVIPLLSSISLSEQMLWG